MLNEKPEQPLILFVNVLNNIKEVENHFFAQYFLRAGFNVFSFDGPGQGEMHKKMRLTPDYEQAIITIIDWLESNNTFNIDMERIGVIGMSFGGLSSVIAAALDSRIDCVISNGGYAYFPPLSHIKKLSIPTRRSVYYMTGYNSMKEISKEFGHVDIKKYPPLERPMLIIQGGKDKTVPPEHAYYFMEWATGKDKELLYFEDSGHCCQDRFDLVIPYTIDWFRKYLINM
jgi:dipeptidyl aminopeptidase/acylaminoacyl peptidase